MNSAKTIRKIIAAAFILLVVLCCFLFFRYIYFYNQGNDRYERLDYAGAIESYEHALSANPPHFKECSVRVNLALSMIYNMGPDWAAPENVDSSIQTLMEARDILLEDGCATDDGDGHSEPAQQLKEEIDKLLEQLQQQQQSKPDDSETETDGGQGGEPPIDEEVEQGIKEEMQNIQNDAFNERQEEQQMMEDFDADMNFDYNMKIW